MSFLFRPTPVVNLGAWSPSGDAYYPFGYPASQFRAQWLGYGAKGDSTWPGIAGKMWSPDLNQDYRKYFNRLRSVDTRSQPWISSSGTMGSFMPAGMGGLGDDAPPVIMGGLGDDATPIDFSGSDSAPSVPDFTPPDLVPPDLGSPSFSPNLPAWIPAVAAPPAPSPIDTSMYIATTTLTPPAAAGPVGTGIPGTQPLNVPSMVYAAGRNAAPPSWFGSALNTVTNSIKSFFSPSPAKSAYTQLPGYGGAIVSSPASWFSAKTLPLSQQLGSNAAVVGVAVLAVIVLGGGAAARRSRR